METGVLQIGKGWPGLDKLSVGFTTRHGGVSKPPYDTFNLGLHVGDESGDVVENRTLLLAKAGFRGGDDWVIGEQVHANQVACVTEADRGKGFATAGSAVPGVDALATDVPGLMLAACFADCVPVFLYDPVNRAVAIAHAGWKGTSLLVARRTVERMGEAYGSEPGQLYAAIGPAIGGCCYEVDDKVVSAMASVPDGDIARKELDDGKAMLDLKLLNEIIMIKAGILPTRIEVSPLCTGCRTDVFFSHRKEAGRTGRMVGWIGFRRE